MPFTSAFVDAAKLRVARFRLRAHYRATFLPFSGKVVFDDLSRFAGTSHDLYRDDARQEAYLLGMRRLLLRMARFSTMTLDELEAFRKAPRKAEEAEGKRTIEVEAREVEP